MRWARRFFTTVADLAGVPIIPAQVLEEAWPEADTFGPRSTTDSVATMSGGLSRVEGGYIEIATRFLHKQASTTSLTPFEVRQKAEDSAVQVNNVYFCFSQGDVSSDTCFVFLTSLRLIWQ